MQLMEAQGVFSANEDLEDIQTASLRFLLLHFFRGELLAQTWTAPDRLSALPRALTAYDRCAGMPGQRQTKTSCSQAWLSKADTALFYRRYLRRCKALQLLPTSLQPLSQQPDAESPATLREKKLARFRESKQLRSKLQAAQRQMVAGSGDELDEEGFALLLACDSVVSI